MKYFALACDYDGTLAERGRVTPQTIRALEELRATGRRLILVSGRQLDDLLHVFPHTRLFDAVVAENGGVFFDVMHGSVESLAGPPSDDLVRELRQRHVDPLSTGRVIVATWEPHEQTVLTAIHDLKLELQLTFNKGAVMVLPSGVNKATGLHRALKRLKLSSHNIVGIGDAENDLALLSACGCAVAVNNALDSVKARVDWVTASGHGDGVIELIRCLIESDLEEITAKLTRFDIPVGHRDDGSDVRLSFRAGNLLVAGPSGAGKTTLTAGLLENLCRAQFQFCVVDPEGDYDEFPGAIALRSGDQASLVNEAMRVLDSSENNAVVNLMDLSISDRPLFLQLLLPRVLQLRAATGRPHWIVIDEAHHLLPASGSAIEPIMAAMADNVVLVTVHPEHVARTALRVIDAAAIVGREPQLTVDAFFRGRGVSPVQLPPSHEEDQKLAWWVPVKTSPFRFRPLEPVADRQRHQRKYSQGELGEDRSFYFRGPDGRLNLRAQNLELFKQIGDGVDDDTWAYHLQRHDVSRWFREVIKDDELADETADIERAALPPPDSRARIRRAIERRYST